MPRTARWLVLPFVELIAYLPDKPNPPRFFQQNEGCAEQGRYGHIVDVQTLGPIALRQHFDASGIVLSDARNRKEEIGQAIAELFRLPARFLEMSERQIGVLDFDSQTDVPIVVETHDITGHPRG